MRNLWLLACSGLALAACSGGGGSNSAAFEARFDALSNQDASLSGEAAAFSPTSTAVASGTATYDGVFSANASDGPALNMSVYVPMDVTTNFSTGATSVTTGGAVAGRQTAGETYGAAGGNLTFGPWQYVDDAGTRIGTTRVSGSLTDVGHTIGFNNVLLSGGPEGPFADVLVFDTGIAPPMTLDGGSCSSCSASYRGDRQ